MNIYYINNKIKSFFRKHTMFETIDGKQTLIVTKNSIGYFKELTALIDNYKVNNIKYKDEYIWPYIRNRLWIQLYGIGNGNIQRCYMPPTAIQRGSRKDLSPKQRAQLKKKYNVKEVYEINEISNLDFLFITVLNASEQVELDNGKIYHRLTDPIYEIAKTIGSAKKIEFARVKTKAIEKSNRYYHKVEYIFPPQIYKTGYTNLMKFGNLLSKLKQYIPSIIHNGQEMREAINWELHTRDFYIDVLKKLNPKIIFLNGFHFQAPLISAAHFLGIKTVDVQHGIQVGWNPLYNDWKEMPEEGYQALPDYFFVWGHKEYSSIQKVFKGRKHTPIIAGFPWLEEQLNLYNPLDIKYIKKFNDYDVIVMLTLQRQSEVPKIYKDLIENSPKNYLWIVRHHPAGNRFKLTDFTSIKIENIIIDTYIDAINLSSLFRYVNIVVSEGSTVAAEADYFGVYNFIFSKKGRGNYKDEIKNGDFFYIKNYKEFYKQVNILDLNDRVSRAKLYEKVDLKQVLAKLLEKSKGVE